MVAPALVWPRADPVAMTQMARVRRRLEAVRPGSAPGRGALALIAAALGIAPPPEAAVARLGEGLGECEPGWFRGEPVMLVPDRDGLVFAQLRDDPLTAAEEDALIAATNAHFGTGEVRLERSDAGTWYAHAPGIGNQPGVAPEAVERVHFHAALMSGEAGGAALRLLNEVQMLWHAHPVNTARRAAGRMQANALWLWGGGMLPPAPSLAARSTLIGSDRAVQGLAAWLRLPWEPLRPPAAAVPGAGAVIAIGDGEDALGAQWLEAFGRRRAGFRLLTAAADWRVPKRLLSHW